MVDKIFTSTLFRSKYQPLSFTDASSTNDCGINAVSQSPVSLEIGRITEPIMTDMTLKTAVSIMPLSDDACCRGVSRMLAGLMDLEITDSVS